MRVLKVTCDVCDKQIPETSSKIAMGVPAFNGKLGVFKRWHTFDLCEKCFDAGQPAFKSMWQKFCASKETK